MVRSADFCCHMQLDIGPAKLAMWLSPLEYCDSHKDC
jgi:hypothetical protein